MTNKSSPFFLQWPRQCVFLRPGYRRGVWVWHRSPDPLHPHPVVLLRQRHQHRQSEQHGPPGWDCRWQVWSTGRCSLRPNHGMYPNPYKPIQPQPFAVQSNSKACGSMWLMFPSLLLNRTQLMVLGRTRLWRSCTGSVRRAAAWTTGFLRSPCLAAELGPYTSLLRCWIPVLQGNTHPTLQDDPVFSSLDPPEENSNPGSAWPARGAPAIRRLLYRPCQGDSHSLCEWGQVCHESDKRTLILCADEVWRERRSEFCILWSTERESHVEARAVGDEAVLRKKRS